MNTSAATRILLVDDEILSRKLIRQHLPPAYEVTECADAHSALREARAQAFDVALVDVMLPDMDGFALCRKLKSDPLTADIPVVVVTAKSGIEDLEKGFESGATDYIRKPFNHRELLVRLRNTIELKQRGDAIRGWNERVARDLALAGVLQRNLLAPRPYLHEAIRLHTAYQPSIEVGGDFFDLVPLPDGQFALLVGDVAGHGVGAAIASTLIKARLTELLRAHAEAGPARVANELHRLFLDQLRMPSLYATLFLAIMDPQKRNWRAINCGHPSPIFVDAPEALASEVARKGGPPVGFCLAGENPFGASDEVAIHLQDGMCVLVVSDGLLEAENPGSPGQSASETLARLIQKWQENRTGPVMEYLFRGMQRAGFSIDQDDCTALLAENIPEYEIVFRGSISLGDVTLTALADQMLQVLAGWPEESAWAAHLVLVEHGANVLRHGRPAPESAFSVQVRCTNQALELLVRDGGQPWKYEEAAAVDTDDLSDHGRGLTIIHRSVSYVSSHHDGHENATLFGFLKDWKMTG